MTALEYWLELQAIERARNGHVRTLTPARGPSCEVIDLASNDYLGLCRHPAVTAAAARAATLWGAGTGSTRSARGSLELHSGLEAALAEFCGFRSALVFSTGYQANLGVVTALVDAETLIVSDAHVHASLIDACRLARGDVAVCSHNDLGRVAQLLANRAQSSLSSRSTRCSATPRR